MMTFSGSFTYNYVFSLWEMLEKLRSNRCYLSAPALMRFHGKGDREHATRDQLILSSKKQEVQNF